MSATIRARAFARRGLSVFELMVVLAIAFILFIIAYVSTGTIMTKTKVSRVQQEHQAIARALQNYIMDYSDTAPSLESLSQPTVYLASVPRDPFQNRKEASYLYIPAPNRDIPSLIISAGPDGSFDLPAELWRFAQTRNVSPDLVPVRSMSGARSSSMAQQSNTMTEADIAVLRTYMTLGRYDATQGGDGDIITPVR